MNEPAYRKVLQLALSDLLTETNHGFCSSENHRDIHHVSLSLPFFWFQWCIYLLHIYLSISFYLHKSYGWLTSGWHLQGRLIGCHGGLHLLQCAGGLVKHGGGAHGHPTINGMTYTSGMKNRVMYVCIYYIILYCIVLYYIIVYYIVLYYIILYYIIFYYIILYHIYICSS